MKVKLLVAFAVALSGCANLSAVRDISTELNSASGSWGDVANEIAASCEREKTLNSDLNDCSLESQASEGLTGVNKVLGTYFTALADIANDGNFTVQPGLEAVTKSFVNVPGVKSDQVKAVSGLAGLLANLVIEKSREGTLRDLIERGAPAAQTIVRGLDGLVVPPLSRRLETEQLQLAGQFGRLLLAQGDTPGETLANLCSGPAASKMSGTGYLLSLEYCRRFKIIDARTKALARYQSSLREADKALNELQSSKAKLTTKALAERLYKIGSQLQDNASEIKKAFG